MPTFSVDTFPTLILESEDGLEYDTQAGGILCAHPSVKGVPVFPYWLGQFNSRALEALGCEFGCFGGPISEEGAKAIMDVWPSKMGNTWWIEFDLDRLSESMEAWFPVKVVVTQDERFRSMTWFKEELEWVEGRTGFLILENCD